MLASLCSTRGSCGYTASTVPHDTAQRVDPSEPPPLSSDLLQVCVRLAPGCGGMHPLLTSCCVSIGAWYGPMRDMHPLCTLRARLMGER